MSSHAKIGIKQAIIDIVTDAPDRPTVATIGNLLRSRYQIDQRTGVIGGHVQSLVSSGYLRTVKDPANPRSPNVYAIETDRPRRPLQSPQQHQIRTDSIRARILDVMHALGRPVTSREVQDAMGDIPIAVAMVLSTMARMEMIVPVGIVRVRRHDEPTKTTPMMSYACNPNYDQGGGTNKRARMGDPEKMWRVLLEGRHFEDVRHGPVGHYRGNGSGQTVTLTGSQGAMCAGF